jgi:hypothetical protein
MSGLMTRLMTAAFALAVVGLSVSSAEACWWRHRCCCCYSQSGSGAGMGYGAPASPSPSGNAQGAFPTEAVFSLLTEWLRRQSPGPVGPTTSQGIESRLDTMNATLSSINTKLDKLDTIAEAIKKKGAISDMPADRPITPPPAGAKAPAATR